VCPKASKASLICRTEPRLNFIKDVPTLMVLLHYERRTKVHKISK